MQTKWLILKKVLATLSFTNVRYIDKERFQIDAYARVRRVRD